MKKILLIFALVFIMAPVQADNKTVVQCLETFSTDNPSSYFTGKIIKEAEFDNGVLLRENAVITGEVIQVVEAKRAKRNAYFVIKPLTYTDPLIGKTYDVKDTDWQAKVVGYKPFDAKETAKSAGVSVANFFVQGFSTVYHFGDGVIHPEEDKGRFKSGVHNAYEHSIFSYVEEGSALNVNEGDLLALKFFQADVPKWKFWKRNK